MDDDDFRREFRWRKLSPDEAWAFIHQERPLYTDEETIDLMIDKLERQIPVVFSASDKQFLHKVGMK